MHRGCTENVRKVYEQCADYRGYKLQRHCMDDIRTLNEWYMGNVRMVYGQRIEDIRTMYGWYTDKYGWYTDKYGWYTDNVRTQHEHCTNAARSVYVAWPCGVHWPTLSGGSAMGAASSSSTLAEDASKPGSANSPRATTPPCRHGASSGEWYTPHRKTGVRCCCQQCRFAPTQTGGSSTILRGEYEDERHITHI